MTDQTMTPEQALVTARMMANICYNLGQNGDVDVDTRELLMAMAEAWDRDFPALRAALSRPLGGYAGVTVWIGDKQVTRIVDRAVLESSRADALLCEFRSARNLLAAAPAEESLTTEQPEDGPAAWLVDYGDGSDPEAYVGERPPGVAVECSMTPLYPESVKAERDALREQLRQLEQRDFQELARANERIDALMNEVRTLRDDRRAAGERVKELEADAARYRWLREECKNPIGGLTIARVTEWSLEGWSGDDPDNRIDAAMQEGE